MTFASTVLWGEVAGVTRLELAASGVTGQRSNQLSYTPLGLPPARVINTHAIIHLV